VITSNVNSIDAAPDPEPLDECAPVMATSCWLAIVDSSLIAGCAPDERTQDILARRGLITRPTRAFVDIAIDESSPRVPGRPLPPASFRRLLAPTPASVPATTRSDGQIYDDLTSENTAVEPKHSAAPVQLVRASAPKKSAAKNAPTKALPNEMLSLFG